MTYIFALRPLTNGRLLPQLEAMLARRPELEERAQTPQVWRAVELPSAPPQHPQDARTRRRRLRYRTLGVMMLLLGALLVIPELVAREISGSLIVGVIALAWGIFTLAERDRRVAERVRPETSAQRLLNDLGGLGRDGAHAIFNDDGLALETPDGERVRFSYSDFESVLETRDLLLLSDGSRALTLQKRELTWGEWAEFRDFLAEKADIQIVPHGK